MVPVMVLLTAYICTMPIRLLISRLINHLSTCLPTYRPRRRLIIFNLPTSLCALWVPSVPACRCSILPTLPLPVNIVLVRLQNGGNFCTADKCIVMVPKSYNERVQVFWFSTFCALGSLALNFNADSLIMS